MELDNKHNWAFNPRMFYGFNSIEIAIRKIFSNQIDHEFYELFKNIDTYCMFIGYPRSGHTLIGSIIDAHPNAIIAHELDVLRYIKAGFSKEQTFNLILKNSSAFSNAGRRWDEYTYIIQNQWNGRFNKLKVIGDKKGGGSTQRLAKNPLILKELYNIINVKKIKIIHVIRNPYDNITSIFKKHYNKNFTNSINFYFSLCKTIKTLKTQIKSIMDIRHESFIDKPNKYIIKICNFLELDTSKNYIDDCKNIVFKNPHKRRFDIQWKPKYIDIVKNKMNEFDFLREYSFYE
jgi:hypothetical protein